MDSKSVSEMDCLDILAKYFPVAAHALVRNVDGAKHVTKRFSFPVVLKLVSSQVTNRTSLNAVRLVKNEQDLDKEFAGLLAVAQKNKVPVEGILVQEYVKGEPLNIVLKKEDSFGHVIGLDNKVFRMCPLSMSDAEAMINQVGIDTDKVNVAFLKKMMVTLSILPDKLETLKGIKLDPVIIDSRRGKVVDAHILH